MQTETEAVVATTTVETIGEAERLGNLLVESNVAACVSIVADLTSIYRWKGSIHRATEFQLQIKTTENRLSALEQLLEREHPYEIYELIVTRISHGSREYLAWLKSSVR